MSAIRRHSMPRLDASGAGGSERVAVRRQSASIGLPDFASDDARAQQIRLLSAYERAADAPRLSMEIRLAIVGGACAVLWSLIALSIYLAF